MPGPWPNTQEVPSVVSESNRVRESDLGDGQCPGQGIQIGAEGSKCTCPSRHTDFAFESYRPRFKS